MQSPSQPATINSNSSQDRSEALTGAASPAGASHAGGHPGGPVARLQTVVRMHRKTLAAAAVATLAAGYAAKHAVRILRARQRVQQALDSYADAEAELEEAEARGWLGFGRKKTPLERAEENF